MSELMGFSFGNSPVRVIEQNGEPWFVAKDVAEALGYAKPRNAIAEHCKGASIQGVLTTGGMQSMTVIPERDLYRLIMRSKLPSAERFEEWVVGTVLPSVRKHGGYVAGQEHDTDPALIMAKALQVADSVIKESAAKLAQAEQVIAAATPKVAFVDRYVDASGLQNISNVAKMLNYGPIKFSRLLESDKVLYRCGGALVPKQEFIDKGLFALKTGEAHGHSWMQTKVTARGVGWLAQRYATEVMGA
ncbi:phage antirepressor Ant [Oceanisphaera sediminis]|uniref:Phage antirepressor Ant n=1 Tax=Oceanisphaera sediminis TaxID=981381 RepID=A0ABP7DDM8_9GAMM